jgi:hypothetical protein
MSKRKAECTPEEWEREKAMSRARNQRYLAKGDPEVTKKRRAATKAHRERLASDPAYSDKSAVARQRAVARSAAWQKANPEKAKLHAKNIRVRNPEKEVAKVQRRNAEKLRRCAPWADTSKINRIYYVARRLTEVTGVQHHVDHVIPLRGKNVSGLHVPENLMVVAYDFNCSKANRYEV